MKNAATLFLRIVLTLGSLFVLAFIILVTPEFIDELVSYSPVWFHIPIIIGMYLAALPFYFAVYQTFKLLHYIDDNKAFSKLSVKALKKIKYAALILSAIYAAITPFFYIIAQAEDAPGVLMISLVITGAGLVVATFAAVIQMVLGQAINLKKENDLTV